MRLSPDLFAPQGAVPHHAHHAHQGLRLGAHRATPATIAAGASGAIDPAFDLTALLMPIDGIDSLEAATSGAQDARIFDVQLPELTATAPAELDQKTAVALRKLSLPLIFGRDEYPVDDSESVGDDIAATAVVPIVAATPPVALQIVEQAKAVLADAAPSTIDATDGDVTKSPTPATKATPEIVVEPASGADTAVLTAKPTIDAATAASTTVMPIKITAPDVSAPEVVREDPSVKTIPTLDVMPAAQSADGSPKPAVVAAVAAALAPNRSEKSIQPRSEKTGTPAEQRPAHEIEPVTAPAAHPVASVHHVLAEIGAGHQTPQAILRPATTPPASDAGDPARASFSEPSSVSELPSRLIDTMRMQMRAGGGQAEIRLAPEFLGSVRLSVVVDHGVVKATLSADSPGALESLPWDVDRLRASLESHGLHLDEFELRDDPYGSSPQDSSAEHQREEERPRRQPQLATPARGLGFGEVFDVIA